MNTLILYRIDPEKRMHRFYRLAMQPDLFGQWCVTREWGRIGSSSRIRSAPYPTPQEAKTAFERCRKAKTRRGYK
jgi:predicted DNA-binding WGR domain protein